MEAPFHDGYDEHLDRDLHIERARLKFGVSMSEQNVPFRYEDYTPWKKRQPSQAKEVTG